MARWGHAGRVHWLRKSGIVFDKGESTLPRADLRKDGRFKVRIVRTGSGRHKE